MYNEALRNGGGTPQYSEEELAKFRSGEDLDNYPNKRHYDDLVSSGSGFQTDHYVSLSGGTERNSYMLSFNYLNQQGIVAETDYERYNIVLNMSSQIMDNLKVNVKFLMKKSGTVAKKSKV